jgi:hypothetical protein
VVGGRGKATGRIAKGEEGMEGRREGEGVGEGVCVCVCGGGRKGKGKREAFFHVNEEETKGVWVSSLDVEEEVMCEVVWVPMLGGDGVKRGVEGGGVRGGEEEACPCISRGVGVCDFEDG